ncbi:MAG: hypothetical protein GY847_03105 [Proteobacteria bacterium]|nr:hypothetical protein [Pseudomonadota bacterium]
MQFPLKTLTDLEWFRLLDYLAQRCTGDEAAELCGKLPFLDSDEAQRHLSLVDEFLRCVGEGDLPPNLPIRPVGEWLERIRGEGSVPAEALQNIAANIKLFTSIGRFLQNRRDICPLNCEIVIPEDGSVPLLSLARLAAELESSFEPDGEIADGASSELGGLRRQVVTLRKRLVSRIEKIAEREKDLLRESTITIRNDRFVLPVRADAHRRFSGLVHGASGSGATIFIEPEAMIEVGNDLMLAREKVAQEEARILALLCQAVRDQIQEVQTAYRLTIEVEVRIAAARLARDINATIPKSAPAGEIDLVDARHPLLVLDGVEVVPSKVHGIGGQSMVISGPNAGGKTVVLKTIGLLGLMLSAGLPISAGSDSRLGVPYGVLTDIGDDQSLEKNLSTFSAHMTNIASICESARNGSIVLLDELSAGTDPGEGAALAEAFLERLNKLGVTTFATTHFDTLKGRSQAGEGFVNAAVGFDIDKMRPTFELRIGTPGSSSALAMASRFGAPDEVIDRAREILPRGMHDLTKAVEALEEERRKGQLGHQALTEARQNAEKAKRRHDEEVSRLRAEQSKFIDKEADLLWSAIKRAREKVRDAEISIRRRRTDATTVTRARKEINAVAEELAPGGDLSKQDETKSMGRPSLAEEIVPGVNVYIKSLGATGIVESNLKSERAYVRVGNVKTRVRLDDLYIPDGAGSKKLKPSPTSKRSRSLRSSSKPFKSPDAVYRPESAQAIRTSENTIDLRGMTVDEAVNATDGFLDQALREDWEAIFILHGHGTGALRGAVRDYLAESSYVESFRPGEKAEGGDGVTVAWLR